MHVTARAWSSSANLGPGFDAFGLAVRAFHDEVTLRRIPRGTRMITDGSVPSDPARNTAGLVVARMAKMFKKKGGLEITVKKGVPPGMGLGSSGASAAAAAVAFDRLHGLGLGPDELVRCAGAGETASAGTAHYDNVAASVLGGFVIAGKGVVRIRPPAGLRLCIAIPDVRVPRSKTRASRALVPKRVPLADHVSNMAAAASMAAGFATRDPALIGRSATDVIAEPARARTVPGLAAVRRGAVRAGAHGAAISGAGPSVIAFADRSADLGRITSAMSRGFKSAGIGCRTVACAPAPAARILP
ncbi:MAG: homoserine kinase [Nitrosopumilus sp.]|nr:homoserine kinase [Nitrosopumilus sp.]